MKVEEFKSIISKLPDYAEIKVAYKFQVDTLCGKRDRCLLKDVGNITKVINMDTNIGEFVINIKE